jgi:hypothetical protein
MFEFNRERWVQEFWGGGGLSANGSPAKGIDRLAERDFNQ